MRIVVTKTASAGQAPKASSAVFVATALFKPSDALVADYIRNNEAELDDFTSEDLIVNLPQDVVSGDTSWMQTEFSAENRRFPGLQRSDMPCLWIEHGAGGHTIVPLRQAKFTVKEILAGVTDAAAATKDIAAFTKHYNSWLQKKGLARSEFAYIPEAYMKKSTERLISMIFGAVFLAAMLAIVIFIPDPTPTQFFVFRAVLAIAAGMAVAFVTGFAELKFGTWLKAGGGLAIAVLVFLVNPPELLATQTGGTGPAEPSVTAPADG